LKVADFGLSLPKYDSASEYVGSNSARSNESLRAKPLKGTSCKHSVALPVDSEARRTLDFTFSVFVTLCLYIRCPSLFIQGSDFNDRDCVIIFEDRYMAPELSTKFYGSEEIDRSVDVFSFAIIVQEVLLRFSPV